MLRGIDISTWQAVGTGDGDYDFVICKATGSDAGDYVDSKCDQHYQRAKGQGKLLGVYHFADPSASSAREQADFFVDNIQGYIGEAILVLDFEKNVWNVAWAKEWLDRVYERTGVKPLIYMSGSVATSYDWSSVVKADYGLWIAYWNKYQYNWDWPTSPDEMTYGTGAWPFWAIWQFSSRNGTLDCDVANMDKDGWMKYAAVNGEAKPAPAGPEVKLKSNDEIANEVIKGLWGNGKERQDKLFQAGYDYAAVQNRVNELLAPRAEYYTIVPGDTLSEISVRYGTSINQLCAWNGIQDANRIYAGQTIRVK